VKTLVSLLSVLLVSVTSLSILPAQNTVVAVSPITMERNEPIIPVTAGGAARQARGLAMPDDPVALVRTYLASQNPAERAAVAERIAAHRDYRPSRLRSWLQEAMPFAPHQPGRQTLTVDIGAGVTRRVFLVVPVGYRPNRAWPLIYALRPSGVSADEWAGRMQRMLGDIAQEFVIASPEFDQNYILAPPPFVPEHAAILDAVARRLHVDASRVYPFGYSKGGFGAWFVSLSYPDRVAGAISVAAGFDVAPGDDGFWKLLLPNVSHVPVLNTWGEYDTLTIRDLDGKPAGTFAASNRRFQREVSGMGLPITNLEVPGGAHNDLSPPFEPIRDILVARREADPRRVVHTFRHLHQASCYWLEGLTWVGDRWGDPRPPLLPAREGESASQTLARTFEPLLGRLTGEIAGQTIRVTRRHIGDIVIWFGERTVDWNRPVTVDVDGTTVFTGPVTRDVGVALTRAAATMDFDALRFAGLRVDAAGHASMVTGATVPEPVWKSGMAAAARVSTGRSAWPQSAGVL
jgi:predicted esterase